MTDEPRGSMHTILYMGVAGLGLVVLLMMFSLGTVAESGPTNTRAKLATMVVQRFDFTESTAEFVQGEKFTIFVLRYVTKKNAGADADASRKEMGDVARFVWRESQRFKDRELFTTEQIQVKRVELHASGCSRTTFESEFTLDIPHREGTAPPDETK